MLYIFSLPQTTLFCKGEYAYDTNRNIYLNKMSIVLVEIVIKGRGGILYVLRGQFFFFFWKFISFGCVWS